MIAITIITGAIKGTFREKLYHELGFESFVNRRWYHKLGCFCKVFKTRIYSTLFLQLKEPILQEIMISCLISK